MSQIKTVVDQMGREVTFTFPPKRIVSLVPSQTEFLYHIGLAEEIVGQTIFCIHPADMHKTKPRIGGTKSYHFDKIAELKPDLIIGNKEENDRAQIEKLAETYPVWMSDIEKLDDALEMMKRVGALVNKEAAASATANKIKQEFDGLNKMPYTKNCGYLIWRNPWMAAGHHTFINDMLNRMGLKNVFTNHQSRYPEISNSQLKEANPEIIFLSSEPYPFKEKHIAELLNICPDSRIMLVDGELFSWYGNRLLLSKKYFEQLLQKC